MLPKIRPDFISEAERQALLEWAQAQRRYLQPNGAGRQFRQLDRLPAVHPLCEAIAGRIREQLGLMRAGIEPRFRFYLSIIDPGGQIHCHRDAVMAGFHHLRCNLFLQLPDSGGRPVVEGESYPVRVQDLLYFHADQHDHWSETAGPGQRIILSYGFLVPAEE